MNKKYVKYIVLFSILIISLFCILTVSASADDCAHDGETYIKYEQYDEQYHTEYTCCSLCDSIIDSFYAIEHNIENGMCTICFYGCTHTSNYFKYSVNADNSLKHDKTILCSVCNYVIEESVTEDHYFIYGHCYDCNYDCTHSFKNGICSICSFECEHEYNNGFCITCGYLCSHSRTDVTDAVFKDSQTHTSSRVCKTCNSDLQIIDEYHDFVSGVCNVCSYPCLHDGETYQRLVISDENSHVETNYCSLCDEFMSIGVFYSHDFTDGQCECGYACEHNGDTYSEFVQSDDQYHSEVIYCSVCKVQIDFVGALDHVIVDGKCECGYACTHIPDNNGICTICGHCDHWGNAYKKYEYTGDADYHYTTLCCKHCDEVLEVIGDGEHEFGENYICTLCDYGCTHEGYLNQGGLCEHCGYCYHNGVHNVYNNTGNHVYHAIDSVCSVCGQFLDLIGLQEHVFNKNGMCIKCDFVCPHEEYWGGDSICDNCGYCDHDYQTYFKYVFSSTDRIYHTKEEYCSGCDVLLNTTTEKHDWQGDDKCDLCHWICNHKFLNGTCVYCNLSCDHSWQNGICSLCKITCTHNFVDSVCTVCTVICTHSSMTNGKCDTCDLCYHDTSFIYTYSPVNNFEHWARKFCAMCSAPISSQKVEHTYNGEVCSVCNHICTHSSVDKTYSNLDIEVPGYGHIIEETCNDCKSTISFVREETHTYDQKIASSEYKKSSADCTNPSTFYMSCLCGDAGTSTFTSGKALGHNFGVSGDCTVCGLECSHVISLDTEGDKDVYKCTSDCKTEFGSYARPEGVSYFQRVPYVVKWNSVCSSVEFEAAHPYQRFTRLSSDYPTGSARVVGGDSLTSVLELDQEINASRYLVIRLRKYLVTNFQISVWGGNENITLDDSANQAGQYYYSDIKTQIPESEWVNIVFDLSVSSEINDTFYDIDSSIKYLYLSFCAWYGSDEGYIDYEFLSLCDDMEDVASLLTITNDLSYYSHNKSGTVYNAHVNHTYDQEIVKAEYKKSVATCESPSVYYKTCICGAVGTGTFSYGGPLEHRYVNGNCTECGDPEPHDCRFDEQNVTDSYLKSRATCQSPAIYYFSCACGKIGSETFTYGTAVDHNFAATVTGKCVYCGISCPHNYVDNVCTLCKKQQVHVHVYDQYTATDEYLLESVTCTKKGSYYRSCICGEASPQLTFTVDALGHDWTSEGKCGRCGLQCEHVFGYGECQICHMVQPGEESSTGEEEHVHVFDQYVKDEQYLLSDEPNCDGSYTYHRSCVCGEASETLMFSSDSLGHVFTDDEYCDVCNWKCFHDPVDGKCKICRMKISDNTQKPSGGSSGGASGGSASSDNDRSALGSVAAVVMICGLGYGAYVLLRKTKKKKR